MAWGVGDIVGAEVRLGNGVEVAVGELSNAFSSVGSGSGVGLSDGSGAPIVGVIVGAAVSGVGECHQRGAVGFDEFGVRQGDIGGTGSRQPSSRVAGSSVDTTGSTGNQILSVGKRLSSNAVLSYEQSLGKAESIVKLTVSLTRQVSVIGRAGSDNALDIFYTLTFGAQRDRGRLPTIRPEKVD